jgi:hypothetical protein
MWWFLFGLSLGACLGFLIGVLCAAASERLDEPPRSNIINFRFVQRLRAARARRRSKDNDPWQV